MFALEEKRKYVKRLANEFGGNLHEASRKLRVDEKSLRKWRSELSPQGPDLANIVKSARSQDYTNSGHGSVPTTAGASTGSNSKELTPSAPRRSRRGGRKRAKNRDSTKMHSEAGPSIRMVSPGRRRRPEEVGPGHSGTVPMKLEEKSTDEEVEIIEVSSQPRPTSANEAVPLQVEPAWEGLTRPKLRSQHIGEQQSAPVSADASRDNRLAGFISHSTASDTRSQRQEPLRDDSTSSDPKSKAGTTSTGSADQKATWPTSVDAHTHASVSKSAGLTLTASTKRNSDGVVKSRQNLKTPTMSFPDVLMERTRDLDHACEQLNVVRNLDTETPPFVPHDELGGSFWARAKDCAGGELIPFSASINGGRFSNEKRNTPFVYMGHQFDNAQQAFAYTFAKRAGLRETAEKVPKTADDPFLCWSEVHREVNLHRPGFENSSKWNGSNTSRLYLRAILMCKFQQNPDLLRDLLSTGQAYLAEAVPDERWGCGISHDQWDYYVNTLGVRPPDFPGKNWCGNTTMEVRQYFRQLAKMYHVVYPDRPIPFATEKNGRRRTNSRVCVELPDATRLTTSPGRTMDDSEAGPSIPSLFDKPDSTADRGKTFKLEKSSGTGLPSLFDMRATDAGHGQTVSSKKGTGLPSLFDLPNTASEHGQNFNAAQQQSASASAYGVAYDGTFASHLKAPDKSRRKGRGRWPKSHSISDASANAEVTGTAAVGSAKRTSSKSSHLTVFSRPKNKTQTSSVPVILMERTIDHDHANKQVRALRKFDKDFPYHHYDELSEYFWSEACTYAGGELIPFCIDINDAAFCNMKTNTPFVYMGHKFNNAEQALSYTCAKQAGQQWIADKVLQTTPHDPSETARLLAMHAPGFTESAKWNGDLNSRMYLRAILICKYQQNPNLLRDLLSTGHAYMAHVTPYKRWGCGISHDQWDYVQERGFSPTDFPGKNWCGITTMEVRQYFRHLAKMFHAAYPDGPFPFATGGRRTRTRRTKTRVCVEFREAPVLDPTVALSTGEHGGATHLTKPGSSVPSLADEPTTSADLQQQPPASVSADEEPCNHSPRVFSPKDSQEHLRDPLSDPSGSDSSAKDETTEAMAAGSADQKPILSSTVTGSYSEQRSEDITPTPALTKDSESREFTCVHDYLMPPGMEETRVAIREVEILVSRGLVTPPTTPAMTAWTEFLEALQSLCSYVTSCISGQLPSTVFRSVSLAYDLALWIWVSLISEPIPLEAVDMLESSTTVDCPSCAYTKHLFSGAFKSAAAFVKLLTRGTGTETHFLTVAQRNTFATHLKNILTTLSPIVSSAPTSVQTSGFLWARATVKHKWEVALARIYETIKSIKSSLATENRPRDLVVREWAQAFELAVLLKHLRTVIKGNEEMGVVDAFRRCMKSKRCLSDNEDVFELCQSFVPERCLNFDEKCESQQPTVLATLARVSEMLFYCFPASPVGTLITQPNFLDPGMVDGVVYRPMTCQIGRYWVEKATQFRKYYVSVQNVGPQAREKFLLGCLLTAFRVHSFLFGQNTPPLEPPKHHTPASVMFLELEMMRNVDRIVKGRSGPPPSPEAAAERLAVSFIELDMRTMILDLCLLLLARFWSEPKISIELAGILQSIRCPAAGLEFVDDMLAGLSHLCPDGVRVKMGYSLARKRDRSPEISLPEDVVLNVDGIEKMKSEFFSAGFKVVPPPNSVEGFLDVWLRCALKMGEFIRKCALFCVSCKATGSLNVLDKQFLAFSLVKLTELCEDCEKTSDAVPEGRTFDAIDSADVTNLFQLFPFASDHRVLTFCLRNVSSLMRLLRPLSREIMELATIHIHEPELLEKLDVGLKRIENRFGDMRSSHELLFTAATVSSSGDKYAPFWANVSAEFATFAVDRSLSDFSTVTKSAAVCNFDHWLQETSKMRSEVAVIETNVVGRKMEAKTTSPGLDQDACHKMLDLARMTVSALTKAKTKIPPATKSNDLPGLIVAILTGPLLEMCICDAKEVLVLAVSVLSRFNKRALTPENMKNLAALVSESKHSMLDDILDDKFRKSLKTLLKSWVCLIEFGHSITPTGTAAVVPKPKVVIKPVTLDKLAPSVIMHPSYPSATLPNQTLAPHTEESTPMDLESVPSPDPPGRASPSWIPVPPAAVSPTDDAVSPTDDTDTDGTPMSPAPSPSHPAVAPPSGPSPNSSLSTAKKRKSRLGDRTGEPLPPPGMTIVPSLSGTATERGDEPSVACDMGPPDKIPRLDDGITDYELSFNTKGPTEGQLATTIEASLNVTDELLTLIGQRQSETLDDALKRLAERASHAETVNSDLVTKYTERVEALAMEAIELNEREKLVVNRFDAEKTDLRRKLQIYRSLVFQKTASVANNSVEDVAIVARELRERIERLRAVVLERHVSVRTEQSMELHAILQSDVLRLAETESARRLSVPLICELFENEVAPRFQFAQKLHSDMERRVLEATALLDARERRLSELG